MHDLKCSIWVHLYIPKIHFIKLKQNTFRYMQDIPKSVNFLHLGTCQLSLLCSPYQDRLIYIKRRVLYIHNKLFIYDYGLRPIFCSLFFLSICFLPFDIWVHICVPICRFLSSCLFSLFGYIVYIPKMSGKIIICSLN